ncbi:Uncharacterised protein [Amycolatopsis camponoti]|uniref:SAF domain-containing protein n=1 Tax=Amycolatopsis camponoti TaxID=2606593 RepID=A0A6I8LYN3_9PSEU|nr:SAF domain-containing protein [Amycolatopsis camponoti]VVJ21518.1 Uncharacterised protein [Amycolatopsis camponoti]
MTSIRTDDHSTESEVGSVSWVGKKGRLTAVPTGRRPHRRLPHLLVGVLLVVVCVGGALWWSSTAQDRVPVLAVARPLSVGHALEPGDVREVEVSAADMVAIVPAGQAATVLGRRMATSLGVGSLLTPGSFGPSMIPAAGYAVVAVALKPGQFPLELAPGSPVLVVTSSVASPPAEQPAGGDSTWPATVTGVAKAEIDQNTVVSLQLPGTSAPALARVPSGQVSLVMLAVGDR